MTPWIVVDFETASACDLKKSGSARYAADPTTEILCLAFEAHDRRRGIWFPGQPQHPLLVEAIAAGWLFVAHNAAFEREVWQWLMEPEGWPPLELERWHDTMARAQQMALPGGLERVLQVLNAPVEKDMEGNRLTLSLSRADKQGRYPERTLAVLDRVGTYCLSDVTDQTWLHRRVGWLSAHEREVWLQSQRVNDRGVRIDMDLVHAMQAIVDEASGPLAARFKQITGGLTFGQIQKVKAWCADRGVVLPDLTKETLTELLADDEDADAEEDSVGDTQAHDDVWGVDEAQEHVDLPADVREALGIRQLVGSASVKKLAAMRKCVGFDGRARHLLIYHGTTPGRQAGRLLQPHNFPRGSLKEDGDTPDPTALIKVLKTRDVGLVEAMYGPAVEVVVSSLRHTLIPDPGKVFIAGDYAQIQARTVLALSGQHDKCELMAQGGDPYCDMGETIYKRPITKADLVERQVGKNSVLGLGFQMGARKFRLKYAKKDSLDFCEGVVRAYRKEWAPCVPSLWYDLQDAATKAVWDGTPVTADCGITYYMEDQWLTARFFNGSTIHYYHPQRTRRAVPWDETDVRRGFSYQVLKAGKWVTRDAFGGQLTENAVMKIEREVMEGAKKRLEANGFPIVMEVHDELIAEILRALADLKAFKQIQEDVEPWVRQLCIPIKVDAWMGDCYKK